jgi:ParB/RepB/Spo0J family partition protein
MAKAADRLKALQQRSAAYAAPAQVAPPLAVDPSTSASDDLSDARAYFGVDPLDALARGRAVERLSVTLIAPDLRPEHRQPRLLPPVHELLVDGQPAPAYVGLVAELLDLGRSMQVRQLQPIVVYPGGSEAAAARYLILVGHRRWTASQLVGLETINAIIVDPPAPDERVIAQYVENEERADFSDMERAWALLQMKQALGDAPWDVVEARFQMSRSRRQDLLRLTAFTPEQQMQLARLRLSETQIRPLHTAVRSVEISPERVDMVLARMDALTTPDMAEPGPPAPLDGPTIARLVAKAKREEGLGAAPATAQWVQSLLDQLGRTKRSIKSARRRIATANECEVAQLRAALRDLVALAEETEGDFPV